MPPTTKRIVGPSVSFSPRRFAIENGEVGNKPNVNVTRYDGRGSHDIRPFFLKTSVVSQAKGSAYIEMGKTKVLCSVYGPREIPKKMGFSIKGQIQCEFKFAPFSCSTRRQFQQDQEEKELSQVVKQALEPVICSHTFPKARVDIFIEVLDNDGGALAVSITAAGAALADAGIPMFDLIMGCNLLSLNDTLLIDPTFDEENEMPHSTINCGTMTLGLMPSLQQVSCLLHDGVIEKHAAAQALNKLTDCCHQIRHAVEQVLLKNWKQERKEKTETLPELEYSVRDLS